MAKRQQKKESFVKELNSAAAFHIQPKNATQNYLLESIENSTMTVCIGPAGTGKTYSIAILVLRDWIFDHFEYGLVECILKISHQYC